MESLRRGIAQRVQFRHLIAALTTATCPFCVRWVQIGSFLGIQTQSWRKTDLMRSSEQQTDARIGIFGSTDGIECMPETFNHLQYRSYLSTSDLAMQAASRAHVSECAAPAIRTCQKGLLKPQIAQRLHFWHPAAAQMRGICPFCCRWV